MPISRLQLLLRLLCSVGLSGMLSVEMPFAGERAGESWQRHVIDRGSQGADGTRLSDVNGDALPDIVTGWEQGGVTRLAIHPGRDRVRQPWPIVVVSVTPNVEDAVHVDLDADGRQDVISSCEGQTRKMLISWGPSQPADLWKTRSWKTASLPGAEGLMAWMFAVPLQIDGKHGIDFFAGGKGEGAQIGWWESPPNPRKLEHWKWHPLRRVGWTMSLLPADMDGDRDQDLVFSDRKGPAAGVCWLENPGVEAAPQPIWKEHVIGAAGREPMFLDLADVDADGQMDVLAALKPGELLYCRRLDASGDRFEPQRIPLPPEVGTAKALSAGDIDLDGRLDLVVTCENAKPPKCGVCWLRNRTSDAGMVWETHPIDCEGIKFDLVPLVDLDGDGDLDLVTSEETRGLGVIWYENPAR